MACLSVGVPLVVIPVNGDQPRNARRCADLGVGRVVGPEERTVLAVYSIQSDFLAVQARACQELASDGLTGRDNQELADEVELCDNEDSVAYV